MNFKPIHAILMAVVALFLCFPLFAPLYYVDLSTKILILSLFAAAIHILLGYTGLPSLGHAAFLGTAAYVVGILTSRGYQNFWSNGLTGIASATLLAAFFGLLCVHVGGIRFVLITFALGQVVWGLALKWRHITGGEDGIVGIKRPLSDFLWSLEGITPFYYFVLLVTVSALLVLYLIVKSPFGLSLVGIREDEERMRALGYKVWLHKYLSFVLSGLFCGISGVLWVYYNTYVGISSVGVMLSTDGLLMSIIGGTNFFLGPAVGAIVMILVENIISGFTAHWLIILGLIYIVVIVFVPNGILGGFCDKLRKKV
jgi:branched-chain amino acid transport system permease protein